MLLASSNRSPTNVGLNHSNICRVFSKKSDPKVEWAAHLYLQGPGSFHPSTPSASAWQPFAFTFGASCPKMAAVTPGITSLRHPGVELAGEQKKGLSQKPRGQNLITQPSRNCRGNWESEERNWQGGRNWEYLWGARQHLPQTAAPPLGKTVHSSLPRSPPPPSVSQHCHHVSVAIYMVAAPAPTLTSLSCWAQKVLRAACLRFPWRKGSLLSQQLCVGTEDPSAPGPPIHSLPTPLPSLLACPVSPARKIPHPPTRILLPLYFLSRFAYIDLILSWPTGASPQTHWPVIT